MFEEKILRFENIFQKVFFYFFRRESKLRYIRKYGLSLEVSTGYCFYYAELMNEKGHFKIEGREGDFIVSITDISRPYDVDLKPRSLDVRPSSLPVFLEEICNIEM